MGAPYIYDISRLRVKVDGLGYCAGNGANVISDDGSGRYEAVPDNRYIQLNLSVSMFVIIKFVLEQKTKVCEIRGHLQTQVTDVKL